MNNKSEYSTLLNSIRRFSILPKDDRMQAVRISRFLMSLIAYAISFFLVCLSYWLGVMESWVIVFCAITASMVFTIFYVWMRSGLNLKMADPSLTIIQMVVATIVVMFLMYTANHIRGPFLIIYLIVFLFGIFRLNTRQFLSLTIFVLFTYGLVIYVLMEYQPQKINLYEEMLQWMALASLLPFFAFLGGQISSLRQKLRNSHTELEEAMEKIQEMAIRDELTGVYNRRHVMELLDYEKNRSSRGGGGIFCLAMLDIDHFKNVNDMYGHQAGDAVLRAVATMIDKTMRNTEFCGRYGGEEFLIVLTQTDIKGALICAERVRANIENILFPDLDPDFKVTVTIGLSEYHIREDVEKIISRADEALYRAKKGGRNRVESAW
jgi:diguanylate cyclase (GGDEF)-like protein